MAVLLDEPGADDCIDILSRDAETLISAGTLAEALIVAGRRNLAEEMTDLIEKLGLVIEPLSERGAQAVALAHARWGRGAHSAGLNFGDCFAYALARERSCPLLYVGEDFARTDVPAATPE